MFEDMLDFDAETYKLMKAKVMAAKARAEEFLGLEARMPPEGI